VTRKKDSSEDATWKRQRGFQNLKVVRWGRGSGYALSNEGKKKKRAGAAKRERKTRREAERDREIHHQRRRKGETWDHRFLQGAQFAIPEGVNAMSQKEKKKGIKKKGLNI